MFFTFSLNDCYNLLEKNYFNFPPSTRCGKEVKVKISKLRILLL